MISSQESCQTDLVSILLARITPDSDMILQSFIMCVLDCVISISVTKLNIVYSPNLASSNARISTSRC